MLNDLEQIGEGNAVAEAGGGQPEKLGEATVMQGQALVGAEYGQSDLQAGQGEVQLVACGFGCVPHGEDRGQVDDRNGVAAGCDRHKRAGEAAAALVVAVHALPVR